MTQRGMSSKQQIMNIKNYIALEKSLYVYYTLTRISGIFPVNLIIKVFQMMLIIGLKTADQIK